MHIALFHDAQIPPPKYGGTERVVSWLAQGLLSLGHRVTLIARRGSHVNGAEFLDASSLKKQHLEKFDLTHFHAPPAETPRTPYIVTIHGNGKPGERFLPNSVFVSARHAQIHDSRYFVHNGIDPSLYDCSPRRENYLVFLAKASWKVKNLTGAVELARAARIPLVVLGSRNWPLNLQRLLPSWGGVRYQGMVDDNEKRRWLSRGRGLLFPVRWEEPFGIALAEAMASGCPVFGTPYGALPEIVTPETGALSANASELLAAIREFRPDTEKIRERVLRGLTHLDMARNYVALYEKILAQGTLVDPANAPRTISSEAPETLLPYRALS